MVLFKQAFRIFLLDFTAQVVYVSYAGHAVPLELNRVPGNQLNTDIRGQPGVGRLLFEEPLQTGRLYCRDRPDRFR